VCGVMKGAETSSLLITGLSLNLSKNTESLELHSHMTEDDTFRVLARPDIHKMVILHREWVQLHRGEDGTYDQQKNIKFARHYGWTWIEYLRARKEEGYFS
jgi:hypothetical protein